MRRQLIGRVVATVSVVLIALLLPMASLVQRFAEEDALAAAGLEVQATESVVAFQERADLVTFIADLNNNDDGTRTTVLFADGDAIGPDQDVTPDVRQARETQRAITNGTPTGVEILVPVSVAQTPAVDDPRAPDQSATVIRVVIDESELFSDVVLSWLVLAGLGVGLLALAVVVAELFARGLLRSTAELASTAGQLAAGNLDVRATPSGPPEIRAVGYALNRLAGRIEELLTAERETAADLSHRMRTPLMALRLEADEVRDPAQQARIRDGVLALSRTVDEVIAEARRPIRDGLGAVCDAVEVVQERTAFWSVLAEDQGRRTQFRIPPGPIPVKASAGDLGAAIDILLENVFAHTAEGIAFTVTLQSAAAGGAVLNVTNAGAGTPAAMIAERGDSPSGSTGLGLDIAGRTARASGGGLNATSDPRGMTTVEMTLGPPEEPQFASRRGSTET